MAATIKASDIHARDPVYRKAYDDLEEEYSLINTMIEVRTRANLSQAQLAVRINATQEGVRNADD